MKLQKKILRSMLFSMILFSLNLVLLCISSFGETDVGGIITKDMHWSEGDGPYIITQDILVQKQAHLTIGAGTVIRVCKPMERDRRIPQLNSLDSSTCAITIEGAFECLGRPEKRITFIPDNNTGLESSWYGIVIKSVPGKFTEIAFTDVSGAYNAISVYGSSPSIHHCRIDFNTTGIVCGERGNAQIVNCLIMSNVATGIRIVSANPVIENTIIAFNKNNGIWGDGISKMTFEYNCVFGNNDGNFLDCDPDLGVVKKKNDRKDSIDLRDNIYKNPIFAGSEYDSVSIERDISIPTDKAHIRDTSLAKQIQGELSDNTAKKKRSAAYPPYFLSRYSPCINTGNPSAEYKDNDGSRNDMGIYGGIKYEPKRKK